MVLEDKIDGEKTPTSEESLHSIARSLDHITFAFYTIAFVAALSYCSKSMGGSDRVYVENMPSKIAVPSSYTPK